MRDDRPQNDFANPTVVPVGPTQAAEVARRGQDRLKLAQEPGQTENPEPALPDSSVLCVNCGLCCNGVLYSNIKAERDEVPRLEAAGHRVDQLGERLQFHPPCHYHVGGCCSIYPTRFTKCRTFRCALLKRVDAGDLSLTEATAAVARSKGMVAAIADLDPDLTLLAHRNAMRGEEAPQPGSDDLVRSRKLLEGLALDMFLDRTFRNKPVITF